MSEKLEKVLMKYHDNKTLTVSKLSKQQKAILEYLADEDVGFFKRNLKEICYALLKRKTGREPRYDKAHWRLPHFIAELKKGKEEEVYFEDIYDDERYSNFIARFPGIKSIVYKKDLLKEANSLRASVGRSLNSLYKRGLLARTKDIKVFGGLMGNPRSDLSNRRYYFISKEQCQRLLDKEENLNTRGILEALNP